MSREGSRTHADDVERRRPIIQYHYLRLGYNIVTAQKLSWNPPFAHAI